MTAVGMFAGRGDVVLAMMLALILGFWLGWVFCTRWTSIKSWWVRRKTRAS